MNERIKELLAQAHLDVMEDLGNIDTNQVAEKFAELIVQECIKLFPQANFYGGGAIQSTIKEHFGVEE